MRKHLPRESIPRNLRTGRWERPWEEMPSGPWVPHLTDTLPALGPPGPLPVLWVLFGIYRARRVSLHS